MPRSGGPSIIRPKFQPTEAEDETTIRHQQAALEADEELLRQRDGALNREGSEIETLRKRVREGRALLTSIGKIQSQPVGEADTRTFMEAMLPGLIRSSGSRYGIFAEFDQNGENASGVNDLRFLAGVSIFRNSETGGLQYKGLTPGFKLADMGELKDISFNAEAPVIANNLAIAVPGETRPEGHPALQSFLGLPVHHQGQVCGFLGLANRKGG